MNESAIEEILALDSMNLRDAGSGSLDTDAHRTRLEASLPNSRIVSVRRDGALVAYGYLWPNGPQDWFMGGISIHPRHRTPAVIVELARTMQNLLAGLEAGTLRSHVLKTNAASLRLHRRLNFTVEMENDKAFAFVANIADLVRDLGAFGRRTRVE